MGCESPDLPDDVPRLRAELAQTRQALQDFLYAVSHDLRAPLRHVHAYAQVLAEDWPGMPAEAAAHLTTIGQAAQQLTAQLEGLTQLSRLATQPLQWAAVDGNALLREVAAEVQTHYPQQAVAWQWAADLPLLWADAALLRLALQELLDNALKFSCGAAPAQVVLTWQAVDQAHCRMDLTDAGVGFAPEQAQALFKPFGKLHPARDFPGLGLGLVRCRSAIQRLGGRVDLVALPGRGCRAELVLPLAPAS